jgi:PII-like signaling protein
MISEKSLQRYLMRRARQHGIYARKVIAIGNTGFPDAFLVCAGRVVLVELKSPTGKGRLSMKQEREIARLREQGVNVYVVDSREGVDNVIKQLADA